MVCVMLTSSSTITQSRTGHSCSLFTFKISDLNWPSHLSDSNKTAASIFFYLLGYSTFNRDQYSISSESNRCFLIPARPPRPPASLRSDWVNYIIRLLKKLDTCSAQLGFDYDRGQLLLLPVLTVTLLYPTRQTAGNRRNWGSTYLPSDHPLASLACFAPLSPPALPAGCGACREGFWLRFESSQRWAFCVYHPAFNMLTLHSQLWFPIFAVYFVSPYPLPPESARAITSWVTSPRSSTHCGGANNQPTLSLEDGSHQTACVSLVRGRPSCVFERILSHGAIGRGWTSGFSFHIIASSRQT